MKKIGGKNRKYRREEDGGSREFCRSEMKRKKEIYVNRWLDLNKKTQQLRANVAHINGQHLRNMKSEQTYIL